MEEKVIAVVKLAPGEVGFYDELTKIHLTMANPFAKIYDWMNTAAVLRAMRFNRLVLVTGSLFRGNLNDPAPKINMATSKIETTPVVDRIVKTVAPKTTETSKVEEVKEEVKPVEEVAPAEVVTPAEEEEAVTIEEEVAEEKVQAKKKTARKKKED